MPQFAEWESFYVIVGSGAAALIGLQFIVVTLIAENPPPRAAEGGAAFATPTIVHFSAALFLSAILRAPWQAMTTIAAIWGVVGLAGLAYTAIVGRRMRLQGAYKPDLDDWSFYFVLPLAAYSVLVLSAFVAVSHAHEALFGVAGAALALLFIGIHNAWDSVSYHVFTNVVKAKTEGRR